MVAGGGVVGGDGGRGNGAAEAVGAGAAGVEGASGRRGEGGGGLAGEDVEGAGAEGNGDGAEEGLGVGVAGGGDEGVGGGEFDEVAEVHDGDAVGDAAEDAEVVGDEEEGEVPGGAEVEEEVEDLGLDGYVEGAGDFVADEEFGAEGEGAGDGDALALAAGEFEGVAPKEGGGEADFAEEGTGEGIGVAAGDEPAGEGGFEEEVADGKAGVEGGGGILEDHLDAGVGEAEGAAFEEDAAGRGVFESAEGAAEGGLAAAGFAGEAEDSAAAEGEGDGGKGVDAGDGAGEDAAADGVGDGEGVDLEPGGGHGDGVESSGGRGGMQTLYKRDGFFHHRDRSLAMAKIFRIIPALDTTDLERAAGLVRALGRHPLVYGFKLGFALGLRHGLAETARRLREWTDKPLIYDHQKAATDIPDTGKLFAETMRACGMDEVILFPHTGPRTLEAWVGAMQGAGLKAIVGGVMTHPAYLVAEGGFIADGAALAIYRQAAELGVKAFVTPLTKPELVARLAEEVPFGEGQEFYSPGYGAQGGDPGQFPALRRHYLIAGRALLGAADPAAAADAIGARFGEWGGIET